jgi:hypothetical protein
MHAPTLMSDVPVGLTALVVFAPQTSASAVPLDAPALKPPPLPGRSCKAVGADTMCSLERTIHEDNVPTGIPSGSGASAFVPVDQSFAIERITETYDRAGIVIRRSRS